MALANSPSSSRDTGARADSLAAGAVSRGARERPARNTAVTTNASSASPAMKMIRPPGPRRGGFDECDMSVVIGTEADTAVRAIDMPGLQRLPGGALFPRRHRDARDCTDHGNTHNPRGTVNSV